MDNVERQRKNGLRFDDLLYPGELYRVDGYIMSPRIFRVWSEAFGGKELGWLVNGDVLMSLTPEPSKDCLFFLSRCGPIWIRAVNKGYLSRV